MVDSGMRIQLRHWCSRLPAAHRLLGPDIGGTILSATSQTHCWRLKCSLICIHLRLASRRGNWIWNSFTIRAQALFRKCVLRRQNGSFSYMNRPSCKVQVGSAKARRLTRSRSIMYPEPSPLSSTSALRRWSASAPGPGNKFEGQCLEQHAHTFCKWRDGSSHHHFL